MQHEVRSEAISPQLGGRRQAAHGVTDTSGRTLLALVAVAVLVTWAGIGWLITHFDFPPLVDWPNHMARHYLEALHLSGRPLPPGYAINYALMPNLGSDLIVPFLIMAFGTAAASKIFLMLAIALYWAGPTLFVLQQGNYSKSAMAAAALLLPWLLAGTFLWGFMNFYSGVGLAFLAATHHVHLARLQRPPVWQLILHAALVVMLYLWHLTAIGIYLVLAGCHALAVLKDNGWRPAALARLVPVFATQLPAAAIVAIVMLTPKLNALSGGIVWSTPLRKLVLVGAYFMAYTPQLDVLLLLLWCAAIALLFALSKPSFKAIDFPLLALSAFALLYLILPVEIGTTSGADIRMLPPLLITSVAVMAKLPLSRFAPIGLALLIAASGARIASFAFSWTAMETEAQSVLAHFARAAPNSRILVVGLDRATKQAFQSHLMDWTVPQNNAYVTDLFAYAGQQTLSLTGPAAETFYTLSSNGAVLDAARIENNFDYVWVFNPNEVPLRQPDAWTAVSVTGAGKLWKIR